MAPNTQIGKVYINDKIYDGENKRKDDRFDRAGDFMENLQTHCFLDFGQRWLCLGGYEDLYDDIIEYFTTVKNSMRDYNIYNNDGLIKPIHIHNKNMEPAKIISNDKIISPIVQYKSPEIQAVMEAFKDGN